VGSPSGPDYPWGLEINLDEAAIKKLGISELPDATTECSIHAVGKVTRVAQSAGEKSKDRSITIQITKLAISQQDEEADDQLRRGYKKGKGPKVGD